MDLDRLHNHLIAVAKAQAPKTDVPYAFERRVMARIKTTLRTDIWSWWSAILWQAATPCLGIMLLLSVWTGWQYAKLNSPEATVNLDAELERTVYAGLDSTDATW